MQLHRRALLAGTLSAAAVAACTPPQAENTETAAVTDPSAVIRPLYDRYLTPDAQFPEFREHAPWSNAMWTEISGMTARSEALNEPILDFDPIIGAQDYQLSDLTVTTEAAVQNSHAAVRARFTNIGAPQEIVFYTVWEGEGWRVDNITGADWDLRQIVAGPTTP